MRCYTQASGADESEVNIVGVNYTMTTSATLSGITAASVNAETKTKLSSVRRCRLTLSNQSRKRLELSA